MNVISKQDSIGIAMGCIIREWDGATVIWEWDGATIIWEWDGATIIWEWGSITLMTFSSRLWRVIPAAMVVLGLVSESS